MKSLQQEYTIRKKDIKKVLVLGSGALQIGQAGEFDYSGSQAIKAMKEEGIKTILINPNIATNQTSEDLADEIYFYPVNVQFVEKVIQKEKPDGILISFGGQTALNCGIELFEKGILEKYNVKVLGTGIQTVIETEDRDLFAKRMREINVDIAKSIAVKTVNDAIIAAEEIGYPVMLRCAFSLGGLGSSVAMNKEELKAQVSVSLAKTPQVLIEEYLGGWKELEYEVMRDRNDNAIIICNMENLDPMGIHTGESIVVAPSQTLTNNEYHKLREISLKIIRHFNIVGECNVQFTLNPKNDEYRVIELNPRLSRSSALASKATGYPIASVAAKLAIGYTLPDIKNSVTKTTTAFFEPALDYVVVKIPRWDLNKFKKVSKVLGSEMKSVGEVMAIGRSFEEALQKASRMLQVGLFGVVCNEMQITNLDDQISIPTDKRIFAIAKALRRNYSVKKINELSNIDRWFIEKIKNITDMRTELDKYTDFKKIPKDTFLKAKKLGFSDKQISMIYNTNEWIISDYRKSIGIRPFIKQIDTLAAEFPAKTNYLYLTYNATEDDVVINGDRGIIVLGSGAYRIGSSVEFDWCCVNTVKTLKKNGYHTIMINYNPETVSTDYDICDKLYFDELSVEAITEVYEKEKATGVILSMGGQIPNNLALKLERNGINILGTKASDIDNAEDRHKFSEILDKIGVDQPEWNELTDLKGAIKFAEKVEYPVLVRPSYVLSGSAMNVAYQERQLVDFLNMASHVSKKHPVVISKFFTNTKEIEVDAVARNGEVLIYAISEHIENAGVHSGDATIVLPPQKIYLETMRRIKKRTRQIAKMLNINGPFNVQFLAKDNMLKVIECNLRASRSFPFVSKVLNCNFIDVATKVMIGKEFEIPRVTMDLDYVGVKASQFSYTRLKGADPILDVEMTSTGEVGCFGNNLSEALLLGMLSTGYRVPKTGVLFSINGDKNKFELLESVKQLEKIGLKIYATNKTHEFFKNNGVVSTLFDKNNLDEEIAKIIDGKKVDLIINMPSLQQREELTCGFRIRRKAIDNHISLITNIQLAEAFIKSVIKVDVDNMKVESWKEFIKKR